MNQMTDFVKRMNVSSISEEFVNPYKFREQDYEVCEYALDHGRKVYAHGGLLQKCGIALPERLADLSVESWPLAPDYIQTAQDYFADLLQEAPELDGAPSLLEMQMIVEGQLRWLCVSSATVRRQEQRVLQLRFLSVDSEKRELARLLNQSESDPLTHAMNRNGLIHAMKQMAQRQQTYAFVMLDVDGFKHFNDTYGHLAGDAVLIHMVEKLTAGLPQEDLVARIGGDEFALCLQMGEDEGIIQQKISHVHAAILSDSSQDLQLSASLGIALCPQDGSTFEELYQKADVAMYCAKRKGGNRYLYYQPDMVMPGQETMERRPRLSQQHYLLRYQPQNQVFQYPPELKEIFRTPFDGRTLWDVLEADHAARPDTVKHLRETIPQLGQSGAPGAHFSEHLLRVANGMWRWFRIGIVATGGDEPMVITLTDVNDELREARQLHHLAEFDELTGLMTHGAFTREADRILAADPDGVKNGDYAMVYFDIHRFKGINDKFGMSEGDRLLIYIANGLQSLITQEEAASRVGSDRFALLLHRQGEALEALLDRYFKGLARYDLSYEIVSNVGVYVTTGEALAADAMLDRAILAQSSIKGNYVTRINYYAEELRSAMLDEQEIVGMMNTALEEEQFVVYYQPQYDHSTGELIGAEALVRWLHPEHGLISPGVFIPIFEKNGFIIRLDNYVFDHVCRFQRQSLDQGLPTVPVSFNLTRYDIYQHNFIEQLEETRQKYQVPTELLRIEITESAIMGDNLQASQIIEKLHQCGYVVEMDDFGSGYSSLNVLKDIELDILKLDMRFLTTSMKSSRGGTILSSVVRMAKWLRLPVIAEGVETMQQADYLKSIGCNYVQGYLYARPMPEADFRILLGRSTLGQARPAMHMIETMNTANFWDPQSQETLIFSNYVGGAAIFDYHDGKVEMLRVNPKYLQEIDSAISEQELMARDPLTMCYGDNRRIYIEMLERAIASGEEEESETWRSYTFSACDHVCIRSTVRLIGRSNDSYLFYEMIRNITLEKDTVAEIMHRENIFRAASEQVNIYYWEYDVASREMQPCFRCKRDLGLPDLVTNYPEPAIEMGIFPPEVADQYRDMHRQIHEGVPELEANMPLTLDRVMFKVRYTTAFDQEGNPVKAYGSAIPI